MGLTQEQNGITVSHGDTRKERVPWGLRRAAKPDTRGPNEIPDRKTQTHDKTRLRQPVRSGNYQGKPAKQRRFELPRFPLLIHCNSVRSFQNQMSVVEKSESASPEFATSQNQKTSGVFGMSDPGHVPIGYEKVICAM